MGHPPGACSREVQQVHEVGTFIHVQRRHVTGTCSRDMKQELAARTCSREVQQGHVTGKCSRDMLEGHAVGKCSSACSFGVRFTIIVRYKRDPSLLRFITSLE